MPMSYTLKPVTPTSALPMLILLVLQSGSLHGYAIAQRIHVLSKEVPAVEEGLLYPTPQKLLLKGWATAEWGISETNRKVRFYRLTTAGRKYLEAEMSNYERLSKAIQTIPRTAGEDIHPR
jgi:PadR family transcriptional regulator, regulatory protein PadR